MTGALVDITHRHVEAVLGLLAPSGHTVYDAEVTGDDASRQYPYLVVYPSPGQFEFSDLGWSSIDVTFTWQVTAVGRDRHETGAALDMACALLLGQRPTVAGRNCGLVDQQPGSPPVVRQDPTTRDPNTARPVFYAVTSFYFTSRPG